MMRLFGMTKMMNQKKVHQAGDVLKRRGVIVYPTETQYGLGAIATSVDAVKRIFLIKNRPFEKHLPVIVGSLEQARKYFVFSKTDLKLAHQFWPGPLSLILKTKSKRIAKALGSDCVAVRVSSNPVARELTLLVGAPIVATSANISGVAPGRTIQEIKRQFASSPSQPDLYLAGHLSKNVLPSTIVRTNGASIEIIREGRIGLEELLVIRD